MKPIFIAVCVLVAACGLPQTNEDQGVAISQAEINSDNGFSSNGFSTNGFSTNGFSTNGFSTNGFSTNGLSTVLANGSVIAPGAGNPAFNAWFDSTPTAAEWMKYFIRCTLPAGEQVTFRTFVWPGLLGVAPNWKYGSPTVADQQRVTACLLAHINTATRVVQLSMSSDTLALTTAESGFQIAEGKFWGNVFSATPKAYACNYNKTYYAKCVGNVNLPYTQDMLRVVDLDGAWGRTCATGVGCSFLTALGNCTTVCPAGNCTTNGVTYAGTILVKEKTPSANDVCGAYWY